jgi:hypothetical protein
VVLKLLPFRPCSTITFFCCSIAWTRSRHQSTNRGGALVLLNVIAKKQSMYRTRESKQALPRFKQGLQFVRKKKQGLQFPLVQETPSHALASIYVACASLGLMGHLCYSMVQKRKKEIS